MSPTDNLRVKAYVAGHLPSIHSIHDVARELGVSAQTLRKDFMRRERISLHDYITEQRIGRMQELLRNTDLSCMAVCLELGCREDTGARLFKQHTGVTMSQFRTTSREKQKVSLSLRGVGRG
jgi:AraC-like DNA-binding protein